MNPRGFVRANGGESGAFTYRVTHMVVEKFYWILCESCVLILEAYTELELLIWFQQLGEFGLSVRKSNINIL